MPELITISERIERRFVGILRAYSAFQGFRVCRFDQWGRLLDDTDPGKTVELQAMKDGDMLIVTDDEQAHEDALGSPGTTEKIMPVVILAVIQQPQDNLIVGAMLTNRKLGQLEAAVMDQANLYLEEPDTHQPLAVDFHVTDLLRGKVEIAGRELDAGIRLSVCYRHDRDNPYQYLNLITPKSV